MIYMMKKTFLLLAVLLLLPALFACNEQSPAAGGILIDDTINVSVLRSDSVLLISGAQAFPAKPIASYSSLLFIGAANGTEALTLVRFGNIPDSLADAEIVDADMILQPVRYTFGDSVTNRLSFNALKIKKLWTPQATIDTVSDPGFLDNRSLALWSGSIPLKDTMAAISTKFDKQTLAEWFKIKAQTKSDSLIYGIALRPDKSASGVIRAFARRTPTDQTQPPVKIRVLYKKNSTASIDSLFLETGYDGTFIIAPAAQENTITLNAGAGQYNDISFRFDSIPQGVAIHGAELTLTLDPQRSQAGNAGRDTVIMAQFTDSLASGILREYYAVTSSTSNTYTFTALNSMVESILRQNSRRGILRIMPFTPRDRNRTDRMVFFGPAENDISRRPLLKIIYSTRPRK
jgi:hypothetical protein